MLLTPPVLLAGLALAAPQANALERPPWPRPAPAIERAQDCHGLVAGHYDEARNTIVICTADRFVIAHEAGHAFDVLHLDDGERNRFAGLLGREGDPWRQLNSTPDRRLPDGTEVVSASRESLSEWFADAYAACRLRFGRGPGERWESSTGYAPSERKHRRVCALLRRAAD
jgi:hypothetical protein